MAHVIPWGIRGYEIKGLERWSTPEYTIQRLVSEMKSIDPFSLELVLAIGGGRSLGRMESEQKERENRQSMLSMLRSTNVSRQHRGIDRTPNLLLFSFLFRFDSSEHMEDLNDGRSTVATLLNILNSYNTRTVINWERWLIE